MPDGINDLDPRLSRRLGEYVAAFDARRPPDPGVDPRSRARWLAALATGAAAVAVGAAAAFVLLDGPRSDTADVSAPASPSTPRPSAALPSAEPSRTAGPSATPSVAPTATATATSTPVTGMPDSWTLARVVPPADDPSVGAVFFGVEWFERSGFIAYGTQENRPGAPMGIWTSADGMTWRLSLLRGNFAGYHVTDIAMSSDGPSRLVAVANRYEPSPRSTVLLSDDGGAWVEAATPENATYLTSVAHGPVGYVAVGYEPDLETFGSDGRVWHSPDGLTWTEFDPSSVDGSDLLRVEVVGDRYVAAGFPDRVAPPLTAWSSTDGREWAATVVVPSSGVGCICVATGSNGSAMVIGGVQDATIAARLVDGGAWEVDTLNDPGFGAKPDDAEVLDDGTLVVTGSFDIADGPKGTVIWVRDPGSSAWRSVAWQDHLRDVDPAQVDLGRAVYVAVAADRAVIMVADGTVLVTSDRVP